MDSQAAPSHVSINVRTWIEVHKMRLLYGSGAVLLLIVAVSVFIQFLANKEVAASQALSEIRVPFNPATPPRQTRPRSSSIWPTGTKAPRPPRAHST